MRGAWRTIAVVFVVVMLGAASAVWLRRSGAPPRPAAFDGPSASTNVPENAMGDSASDGADWFDEVDSTGIAFRHVRGCTAEKPFPAANGSGIGVIDFDRDGWEDLYFGTGTPFPIESGRSEPFNQLHRNVGGLRFQDATSASGTGHTGFTAGVAVGDIDNDGFPDIYLSCYGANVLLHNLGDGTFESTGREAGVDDDKWGSSAAFFDADRDGLLDLYVANYAKWTLETNQYCGDRQRQVRLFCGPTSVEPEPDVYYHNEGDGTFRRATESAGFVGAPGRGQGVVAADVNDDGWIDVYVTNDLNANLLYVNRGDGSFRDISEASGTAYDGVGTRQAGMGVDAADFNEDGRVDLFVTNYQDEHNTLYENLGNEVFEDVSEPKGVALDSLPWIGWGTSVSDFDLDGWLDLIVTNGHVDDNRELLGQKAPYEQPGLLWKGNGRRFERVKRNAGDYFERPRVGRALVVADLDRDGDLDVVIGHQDRAPCVLRNRAAERSPSVRRAVIELVGIGGNRDAVGGTMVFHDGTRGQRRLVKGGGSYLSQSSHRQVVALPESDGPRGKWTIEIRWPDGRAASPWEIEPGRWYACWQDGRIAIRDLPWESSASNGQGRTDRPEPNGK
ncbi:MAG: CRTAC1 family protein [Planctomycetes bacterium]|nr:CRTAC1 family protein [Planctomycetota bacterium]